MFAIIFGVGILMAAGAFVSDNVIEKILDSAGIYDAFNI